MPNWSDTFVLNVVASAEAIVQAYNGQTGSGDSFVLGFWYQGGFNPTATGFTVSWYTTSSDASSDTNAISSGSSRAPSQVVISPHNPVAGGTVTESGEIRGVAPTLLQSDNGNLDIHGRLTILQGVLEG